MTISKEGGEVKAYSEKYPNGQLKAEWEAKTYPNGRYLLHGTTTDYYADGTVQHKVVYQDGRKTGEELFYNPDGTLRWRWERNLETMRGVWTQYYSNGQKRVESHWNIEPTPRDLDRKFVGYVAEGPATHWNEDGTQKAVYEFVKGEVVEN